MEKAGQTPSSPPPGCAFCLAPSEETRLLLRAALARLRRILAQRRSGQGAGSESSSDAPSHIHRLIRVLFEKQQFEITYSKHCPHTRLLALFRERSKCPPQQLEEAMEALCDRLARRNYELEIIALQVKNVESSVVELEGREEGVKEEEVQKPCLEASPATNANYNITFDDLPLAYNILFYGPQFYQ